MIWSWLFVLACVFGFVLSAKAKNGIAMGMSGIFGAVALLTAVAWALSGVITSQNATREWAAHEKRLAWQRSHPKEYAEQLSRARAREAEARVQADAAQARSRDAAARREAVRREAARVADLPENKEPCDYANGRINQGWTDFNGGAYQSAFDDAVKGLAINEHCENDDAHQLNEGFLLSVKGMSEHYLSSGDSRTDLNQAETVLEECQTNPEFYGTHTGASCETQQENDIKATTDWDVYGG